MSAPELIGVGSPLVDLVLEVEDDFLSSHVSGAKGGMEMVSHEDIAALIETSKSQPVQAAGGAASNTVTGCASLGIDCAFIGSIGDDAYGAYYREALAGHGCGDRLVHHPEHPTGHVLSMVTPDAERTMRTFLGAAADLATENFTAEQFADAKVVMLEGYSLYNHNLTWAVAHAAEAAGCELACDLASFEVVEHNKPVIEELLDKHVDIVFVNQDEARALCGDVHAAIDYLAERCKVACVKLGKEGAWVASGKERHHVPALVVEDAIDTTGAGDSWAAGFLAGYLRGLPLDRCAHLGAMAGAAVVQVMGAQVPAEGWIKIRGYLEAWVD